MIGNEDISKIIEDSKAMNHQVKVGDIAYVFLCRDFKDKLVSFKALFGTTFSDSDIETYDKSAKIKFLKKYIKSNYSENDAPKKGSAKKKDVKDISFEENKEALIERLAEIQEAKANGDLEVKDALKLEVDIRTRLNDKFAVSDKQDEQRVEVLAHYNAICPYCHHEIRSKTAEDAVAEIKEKYDLVPKNINNNERENETED